MKKRHWIRLTSALLLAATLLPTLASCGKKDEPDEDEELEELPMDYYIRLEKNEDLRTPIYDFSDNQMYTGVNNGVGTYISKKYVYDGEGFNDTTSIHITELNSRIKNPLETDWSEYTHLVFAIYSEKATNTTVQLRFSNPANESGSMAAYFRYVISVDWTGWKEFSVDIASMPTNYNPTLNNVVDMTLDKSGWNLTSSPQNSLYLSNIYLSNESFEIVSEVSLDDPSIYDQAKDNWRKLLVGDPDINFKKASATYKDRVKNVGDSAKASWELYKKHGYNFGYTINHNSTSVNGDEQTIGNVYSHIRNMACGYATVGSEYYHNTQLLLAIKRALEENYENNYGPRVWEVGTYGNWWWWDIGIPMTLSDILIILEKELGYDDVARYMEPFDYLNKYPSMTACNKVWISYSCYASALLQEDAERLLISKHRMNDVFDYVNSGDGFYEDGSFIQHGNLAYTAGYGLSMMGSLTDLMMVFYRTRFDFIEENVANQYRWALENFIPLNYGGRFFASVRGREVSRSVNESSANNSIMAYLIKMTTYAPKDVKAELLSAIRSNMLIGNKSYATSVPLSLTDKALAIKDDDSITPQGYSGVKVFGNMDRIVQHLDKYGVCVSLNSTRIYKYEAINSENGTGWYHSDGTIYIYTDGYDYGYNFFHYVDPYKIPGTTVTSAARKDENVNAILGSSPFVGGVEAGNIGIAVYEHGYAKNDYITTNITANKTYFLFDNEIVAIGSNISDTSGLDVYTVVENRLWDSDDELTVNGKKVSSGITGEKKETVTNMHFTNMGGYVFFEETDVSYEKVTNTNSFLEIWIDHGTKPKNGTYAYVYLPEATASETSAYSANPDVEILTQTDTIHVVRENKLGATGYAFYDKGSADGVTVSARCVVMVREQDGQYTVSISDPTHELENLTVTLELPVSSVVSADEEASVSFENGNAVIELSIDGNVGNTFEVTLK